MIKALIFDWFGVCSQRWVDIWIEELPCKGQLTFNAFRNHLNDYCSLRISAYEFLDLVCRDVGLDSSDYEYLLTKQAKIDYDLLKTILKLRKTYKTALLSDSFDKVVPSIEKDIGGFKKYFDVVVLSHITKMSKKEPEIYTLTIKQLNMAPTECVFIDDRDTNLSVAKAAGLNTIKFENNEQLKKELELKGIILDA